jgi:hypothetical protein
MFYRYGIYSASAMILENSCSNTGRILLVSEPGLPILITLQMNAVLFAEFYIRQQELERIFLHIFRMCPISVGLIQNLIRRFHLPIPSNLDPELDKLYWHGIEENEPNYLLKYFLTKFRYCLWKFKTRRKLSRWQNHGSNGNFLSIAQYCRGPESTSVSGEIRESSMGKSANAVTINQCCGSGSGSTGSTCFWASRIRILLSSCKNSKKNLDSYYFVTLSDYLSLENNVNVA